MAGDWIKVRVDLADDPAVLAMAEALQLPEPCIVGYLVLLWSWASRHCNDGTVTGVTLEKLATVTKRPDLAPAMIAAGWLEYSTDGPRPLIRFPAWDRHNSQSAKSRALTTRRVAKHRAPRPPGKSNAPGVTEPLPDQEKSRYMVHGTMEALEPGPLDPSNGPESKPTPPQNRRPKPSPDLPPRTPVTSDDVAPMAQAIFDGCRYTGNDGGNLWGVAALMHLGIGELSEAEVFSACRGAALNATNKPAYFYGCLAETIRRRSNADLKDLLHQIQIVPNWPKTPPYPTGTDSNATLRHQPPKHDRPVRHVTP